MFAKKQGYYCDMEAVREPQTSDPNKIKPAKGVKNVCDETTGKMMRFKPQEIFFNPSGRNLRDVWVINPQVWSRAHYATFPEKLVEPIIKVSTSQKGVCPKCGSQWCRVVDVYQQKLTGSTGKTKVPNANNWEEINNRTNRVSTTLGWRPTCGCQSEISYLKSLEPIPAVVYDPFMGSGTVAAVAAKLGRNYCGSELSKDYLDNQANIRIAEAETGVTMEEIEAGQKALFE